MKTLIILFTSVLIIAGMNACNKKSLKPSKEEKVVFKGIDAEKRLSKYVSVQLTTDLSVLTENEKKMLIYLIDAAKIMDELFWLQSFGDKRSFIDKIEDEKTKKFALINYGPWDRLDDDVPFIHGFLEKPKGANFYPADMTNNEFEHLKDEGKTSLYSLIKRDDAGNLVVVPFHIEYKEYLKKAADLIVKAAALAEDQGLKKYLELRAKALLDDNFYESDMKWLDMKTNTIDFVVGPIENYEDALYGYKAAYEAYVLVKDKEWSQRLAYYTKFLPELQLSLPVMPAYKSEKPGTDGELNAYDVIYYAGDCNAGSKTIAINLPNDPKVQLQKGTRRLQLKNTMRAKYDYILLPIVNTMIDESQRNLVKFDAFFANTMFHEVAHGLGVKYLVKNKKTEVKDALQKSYSTIEEGKADILGLYMIDYLINKGELKELTLNSNYVTFVASMFRSIRFGGSSAHGKANMMRFNFFIEKGALIRNADGTYKVDFAKMKGAINELSTKILVLQGDGNLAEAEKWMNNDAVVSKQLKEDLQKLEKKNIPTDLIFEQGKEVLGL